MQMEALCRRCQHLPLGTLLYGPYDAKFTQTLFRKLQKVWAEQTCQFCLLIKGLLMSHYGEPYIASKLERGYDQNLWLYRNPLDLSFDKYDAHGANEEDIAFCLQIGCYPVKEFQDLTAAHFYQENRKRDGDRNRDWVMPSIFAIKQVLDSDDQGVQNLSVEQPGRLVDHDRIDWTLISTWDSACSHHGMEPGRHRDQQPHSSSADYRSRLRVIDVERACIVYCPSDAPYIALSYQWGSDQRLKLKRDNIAQLETPGFFDTPAGQPAQTIQDTITTVRRLGYKYAWVDALCIVQDDVENVILNVDQMDQIYRGAHLTIVAAAGENAYYRLPGVSATPRAERQLKTVVNGTFVANQERLLSNRLLSFTDSQVFFSCSQGCNFQEQFHFIPSSTATYTLADPQANFDFETRDLWELYAIAVSEYTERAMSDPTDKLRAFNGILKYLGNPLGTPFLFGLPTNLFEVALLWKPRGRCKRTALGFPSWSWAGWDAEVIYDSVDSLKNVCECRVSQATITIPETGLEIMRVSEPTSSSEPPRGWHRHFDDEILAIHYTSANPEFAHYRYPRPLSRMLGTHVINVDFKEITTLRVVAMTASLLLTDKHSPMRDVHKRFKTPCKEGHHELCNLAILDGQNHTAGTVTVSGDLVPDIANKKHKFIAIARSTSSRVDGDPSWDAEAKVFRSWTEQEPGSRTKNIEETASGLDSPQRGSGFDWSRGEDEDDDEAFKRNFALPNDDFFDNRYFGDKVYWPAMDVLLVSEECDGVVGRLGVGKIHVDAFAPVARSEEVWLG